MLRRFQHGIFRVRLHKIMPLLQCPAAISMAAACKQIFRSAIPH